MNTLFQFTEIEGFTLKEKEMNATLCELFSAWKESIKSMEGENTFWTEYFVSDGFYPRYTEQKTKVLFLGRESHGGMGGYSYIYLIYKGYMEKIIDGKALEQYALHRRLLKITYGLMHNLCPWEDIPKAADIASTLGKEGGISFAFMNLCKIDNEEPEGAHKNCNWGQIGSFLEATKNSGRDFIAEEIDILAPDVIIDMNLCDKFDYLGETEKLTNDANAHLWRLIVKGKKYPLIDAYHFAAKKGDQADFYDPIVTCMEKVESLL
ncbi:MAG: hypothetical protein LBQ63_01845 [Deltaproteobacteria bacterium]|jgi:hypothetical protein|nr:hypothetical protein [Deltaproteobacteria bacterium]